MNFLVFFVASCVLGQHSDNQMIVSCDLRCDCSKDTLNCSARQLSELVGLGINTKYLHLNANQIKHLKSDLFHQLKQAEQIFLNDNKIEFIHERQFDALERLRTLELQNNRLEWIGKDAFNGLYASNYLSKFSINESSLSNEYFSDLSHNHLLRLKEDVGLLNNILKFTLNVSSNPLICDCELIWLVEKTQYNQLSLAATCGQPDFLRTLPLNVPILPHLRSCPRTLKPPVDWLALHNTSVIKNVIIGDKAIMDCGWSREKGHINWFRNGRKINFNQNSKFRLQSNGSLRIDLLLPKDEDIYKCEFDSKLFAFDLRVVEPPIFTRLPDQLFELDLGTTIELECDADASPKAIITWVSKSLNRNLTTGNRISFTNVTSSIDGNYECIASNQFGYAIHGFTINVRGGELEESRPGNLGLRAHANEANILFTDDDVKAAVQEAREAVDQAVARTIEYLSSQVEFPLIEYRDRLTNRSETNIRYKSNGRNKLFSPSKLMKIGRFPFDSDTIESAKSTEIYERSIELLKRRAEMRHKFQAFNFTYNDLLTANQLNILNTLTGCLPGNRHSNVLKYQTCDNKCHRTVEGVCNNLKNELWGAAMTPFKRILHPSYEDGLHLPIGWLDDKLYNGFKLPSPRKVTLRLLSSIDSQDDEKNTQFLTMFGQFIDHDLSFSLPSVSLSTFDRIDSVDCQTTCTKTPPCYSIPLEPDDPRRHRSHLIKNRNTTYSNCIEMIRSSSFCGSGLSSVGVGVLMGREQVNQITSYLDLSQVYASSPQLASELRESTDGLLKVSSIRGDVYLPQNYKKLWPNDCQQNPTKSNFECFLAGDIRSNEQLALTALHTLLLREHNRIAIALKKLNNHWSGNRIYNEARNILVAKIQHITYDHWLRHVLGPDHFKLLVNYTGYNASEDSTISNVFATAAFRFGHTLIQPFFTRLNESYMPHTNFKSKLDLFEVFFSPHLLLDGGLEPILRGLIKSPMKQPRPESAINYQLTEHLFELARHVSLDLASINIQRGREHGIPDYNTWRKYCGLNYANTFDELGNEIKNETIRNQLAHLYGHPSNIDLWVGCVLEDRLKNATVGPTFACLIREQFQRTRSGDRLWYEQLPDEKLTEIKRSSLAELICLNTDIDRITSDVFRLPGHQRFVDCERISKSNLSAWTERKNIKEVRWCS